LHYKRNAGYEEAIDIAGNLQWSESLGTFGQSLSFDILNYNRQKYISAMAIDTGDVFVLKEDGEEVLRAVIPAYNEANAISSCSGKDLAYYINKSEVCKQIKNARVDEAIKDICTYIGIEVGYICPMEYVVNEIVINTANSVIDSLIAKQRAIDGKMRLKEMRGDKLYIIEYPSDAIDMIFKPAANVAAYNPWENGKHGRMSLSKSMENRYTVVRAFTKEEESVGNVYTASNQTSIASKGMIIKNLEVTNADSANIANIAKQELSLLDMDDITYTVSLYGCSKARAGRVIHIVDEEYDIDGLFRIQSVTHKLTGGVYTMDCTVSPVANENFKRSYSEYKTEDSNEGGSVSSVSGKDNSEVVTEAKKYIGVPYVWGGTTPQGFDCSGLVWYCYKNTTQPNLQRLTAQGYYDTASRVTEPQKGDLCFYGTNGKVTHVGIYYGYGKMIAAEGTKVQVTVVRDKDFMGYGRL
jgi:cell wall-associated NlpC family hydrolase